MSEKDKIIENKNKYFIPNFKFKPTKPCGCEGKEVSKKELEKSIKNRIKLL